MAEYNTNPALGQELGWDDEISAESSEVLLEPGDYPFTVLGYERKRFSGSAKMCACNQVVVKLDVDGVTVEDSLFFNTKAEWRLSQFFIAIGQKKPGEPFRINWNAISGARGVCKVGHRLWKNKSGDERKSNEIKEYYAPGAATSVPAPAATAPQGWQQQTMGGYQTNTPHWQTGKF